MGFGNPKMVLFKDEHGNDIHDCLHPDIPIELTPDRYFESYANPLALNRFEVME